MLKFILYASVRIAYQYTNLNTSHVEVYLKEWQSGKATVSFKYISCWSLSELYLLFQTLLGYLNTSHVEVYLRSESLKKIHWNNLNTSHVEVYRISNIIWFPIVFLFKYISCWSLSDVAKAIVHNTKHLNTSHVEVYPYQNKGLLSIENHLNTSHVEVYLPWLLQLPFRLHIFKYISCWSLSNINYPPRPHNH